VTVLPRHTKVCRGPRPPVEELRAIADELERFGPIFGPGANDYMRFVAKRLRQVMAQIAEADDTPEEQDTQHE
jgi:hypothetical protein